MIVYLFNEKANPPASWRALGKSYKGNTENIEERI